MSKPILCVDFDGCINSYTSGWQGVTILTDPPVPGVIGWLWSASKYFEINIYSSRTSQEGGIIAMRNYLRKYAWGEFTHNPFRDSVGECVNIFMETIKFPTQKPAAFLTIDDRAICFDGDWLKLNPEDMLQFKPWNKK